MEDGIKKMLCESLLSDKVRDEANYRKIKAINEYRTDPDSARLEYPDFKLLFEWIENDGEHTSM